MMDDYFKLSRLLENAHALFYKMYQLGKPRFTKNIPTAAVAFDNKGRNIDFLWNEEFYNSLDNYSRAFVLAHECMHVILNHGIRAIDSHRELANIALDLVVNHTLVDVFGFERDKVNGWENYCWVDTVLPGEEVPTDESFEYYYSLLLSKGRIVKMKLIDDHSSFEGKDSSNMQERIFKELSDEDEVSLNQVNESEIKNAGVTPGSFSKIFKPKVIPKKKWETIIKNWSLRFGSDFKTKENWVHKNRRMEILDSNLLLPSDVELEEHDKKRIEVFFYQDTSGSCSHLAERFFKAARSLPKDRFKVRAFCFDTEVYNVDLEKGELFGFGGTTFDMIETHIQSLIKNENISYPKAVFIITDGYGNKVFPKHPEYWYWFLSHDYRTCIPEECNIYKLEDFE